MKTAAIILMLSAFPAFSDTAKILNLCLDTSLTPDTRTETLKAEGWTGPTSGQDAYTTALTLSRLLASDPTTWKDAHRIGQDQAAKTAQNAPPEFLESPDKTSKLFVGRNAYGLQTCFLVSRDPDLSPLANVLDGSIINTIGDVSRIRGDGPKSLISAHAITDKGRAAFDPHLPFNMTFTVVLDRQPGD